MNISKTDALIIIDPQYDFMPGGALAVAGGDEIVEGIAALATQFADAGATIVVTQDWHPAGHKSFASANDAAPFSEIDALYGKQTMWPDHCVQGSYGARVHMLLDKVMDSAALILRKGMNPDVDSYSAFYENDKTTSTGLGGYLRDRGVKRVVLVGLAYDFCVAYSALDAVREGFEATIVKDLTRAIAMHVAAGLGSTTSTVDVMEREFRRNNVTVVEGAIA